MSMLSYSRFPYKTKLSMQFQTILAVLLLVNLTVSVPLGKSRNGCPIFMMCVSKKVILSTYKHIHIVIVDIEFINVGPPEMI